MHRRAAKREIRFMALRYRASIAASTYGIARGSSYADCGADTTHSGRVWPATFRSIYMDNKQHFSLWYFVGVMMILLAVQSFIGDPHAQVLAYSDFQALLQTGKIKEVTIGDDQLTGVAEMAVLPLQARRGTLTRPRLSLTRSDLAGRSGDGYKFIVARVPDANLVAELQRRR